MAKGKKSALRVKGFEEHKKVRHHKKAKKVVRRKRMSHK